MTVRASSCSVTFIEDISAVIAEPALPATTTAVSIGANSLHIAIATPPPINLASPYLTASSASCRETTAPEKKVVTKTIKIESTPNNAAC